MVPANPYRGYRFPEEIISQCVWLYFNFAVSLREVELMMAYRGVQLSYETIRRWCDTFGASYAAKLKRRRPKLGDKWFLDEVFLKINGVQHYLWRAVDQHGAVIDIWCSRSATVLPRCASFASYCAPRQATPRDHHRQAPQLWSSQESSPAESRSSAEPILEQSRRELASANSATRAPHEALQVS